MHGWYDMIDGPIPGYWMNEVSGVLRPAVEAYLYGDPMTPEQIAAMREYLRQWIAAPSWQGPMIDVLRAGVDRIRIRTDIDRWLNLADAEGIDPL
jgi:hypothetical protein